MSLTNHNVFLVFPCLLIVFGAQRATPEPSVSSMLTSKQEILSLTSELYPQVGGTVDKPSVKKPGYEVEKRVNNDLLAIANKSTEMRESVVHTLVELLEDPARQNGFYFSALWSSASYVLGQLKAVEAVDVLAHHLDIEHGHASLSFSGFPVVHGLIQIGTPAVPKLEEVLLNSESDPRCRSLAAFALGQIGGDEAGNVLERASATEKDSRILKGIELALTVIQRTKNRQ
jgi:HEAT repeat protein